MLKNNNRNTYLFLAVLWILVTAYNICKPYHIDDGGTLIITKWIIAHPLHPMSGMMNWGGVEEPIHVTNQPHLYYYLLAGWISLFGYSEVATHAFQSFFSLACIILFFRIANFYVRDLAIWLTSIMILGPAFVVGQNIMLDVPLLSLWLLFFYVLMCDASSSHQTKRYVIAALSCSAAILVKYSSLVLYVILFLSIVVERRKRQSWTLFIPLLVLAAWSAFNYYDYGGIHIASRGQSTFSLPRILDFTLYWVVAIGGVIPMGIIVLAELVSKRIFGQAIIYLASTFGLIALGALVALSIVSDGKSDIILKYCFIVNGSIITLAVLAGIAKQLKPIWSQRPYKETDIDKLYLALWLLGASAFYVVFAPFIAVRHVLLVLPPLLLLLAMSWPSKGTTLSKYVCLALTILMSVGLGISDWRFANFYKKEAAIISAALPPDSKVWTSGHWGWQWYAEINNIPQIDVVHAKLNPGEYFIIPANIGHQRLKSNTPLTLVETHSANPDLLSLACTARKARFYGNKITGPWSFSRNCIGQIDIYRAE